MTPEIDGLRIIQLLGVGAYGSVYLAEKIDTETLVAVKTPHGGGQMHERFLRECRIADKLVHANVVRVLRFGETVAGDPFLASEYVSTGALDAVLAKSLRFDVNVALELGRGIASGLGHAHATGVVHRDLKPSNILVEVAGDKPNARLIPKLCDFGLGMMDDDRSLTATGASLGTLGYLAPEQARGDDGAVGPTSDVFAFGCLLFEMLTGELPFRGGNLVTLHAAQQRGERPTLRSLGVEAPRGVEIVLDNCLAFDPADRYESALPLLADLDRLAKGRAVKRRVPHARKWMRRMGWRAGIAAAAAVTAIAFALLPPTPTSAELARQLSAVRGAIERGDAESARTGLRSVAGASPAFGNTFVARHLAAMTDGLLSGPRVKLVERDLRALRYSPDGSTIAVGGSAGEVLLVDSATRQVRKTLQATGGAVNSLSFNASGTRVLTGDQEGAAKLWDVGAGTLVRQWKRPWPIEQIAAAPDFSAFAVSGKGGVSFAACHSDSPFKTLLEDESCRAVAYRAHVRAFTASTRSINEKNECITTLRSWRIDQGEPIELTGAVRLATKGHVLWLDAPSPEELTLSCAEFGVYLVDAGTGRVKHEWMGQCKAFNFRVDPTGRFFVGAYVDGSLGFHHRAVHTLGTIRISSQRLWACEISPDGRRIAVGDEGGMLRILDSTTLGFVGSEHRYRPRTRRNVQSTLALPHFISGNGPDDSEYVMCPESSPVGAAFGSTLAFSIRNRSNDKDARIAFDKPNRWPAVSIGGGLTAFQTGVGGGSAIGIRTWRDQTAIHSIVTKHGGDLYRLAPSPNASMIAASFSNSYDVYDTHNGKLVVDWPIAIPVTPGAIAWTLNGKSIYAGHAADQLLRIDAAAGNSTTIEIPGFPKSKSMAFSDEYRLLAVGVDGMVRAVDLRRRSATVLLAGTDYESLALDPTKTILATGDRTGTVAFWDAATGTPIISTFAHPGSPVVWLDFSKTSDAFLSAAITSAGPEGEEVEARMWATRPAPTRAGEPKARNVHRK